MRRIYFIICFVLLAVGASTANGIQFHKDILDEALQMAKQEGKMVFIDTYAQWCAPCKRMNKVFTDPEVGSLYNKKFINVKIDMDGLLGKEMLLKYDVVWLPTLLILDQEGNIKYKVDKEVKKDDLIRMANQALDPNFIFYNRPAYSSSPVTYSAPATTTRVAKSEPKATPKRPPVNAPAIIEENEPELGVTDIPAEPEVILYVYDEHSTNKNPEILYHEAYLHVQLMDNKALDFADLYLNTQTNWATEKNVKFIFDFTESTNSKYFKFFSKNLFLFERYLGEEKVRQSLEMMVFNRLYKGYPRPDLKESVELYNLLDAEQGTDKAHLYYLNSLKTSNRTQDFLKHALNYLSDINPYNKEVLMESTQLRLESNAKGLPKTLKVIDKSLEKNKKNIELLILKSRILYRLGKKKESKAIANKALNIAQDKNQDTSEILAFLKELS